MIINGFQESKTEWNSSDYRFTKNEDKIYAFLMKSPENRTAVIKSLQKKKVQKVKLLGYGPVKFEQSFGILIVSLPEKLPTKYTNCLEITIEE